MRTVFIHSIITLLSLSSLKAVNGGKSLFFLYTMTDSPRLALLYMYFFDYYDSFLPFIHVSCPSVQKKSSGDDVPFRNLVWACVCIVSDVICFYLLLFNLSLSLATPQDNPDWKQWLSFAVQFFLLPYQLSYDFVWDWESVHYWTSRIIMWNCFMLTLREGQILWNLRRQIHLGWEKSLKFVS